MNFLLANVWSDPSTFMMIALVVLLGFMIFFSSRRRRSVQEQVQTMLDSLRPGQRVRTVGGVIGRIKEIREESPGVKTVLLQTGTEKYPAYMTFDVQAIYGVIAEEGHTIDGTPIPPLKADMSKPSQTAEATKNPTSPSDAKAEQESTKLNGEELDAREYVDKRNAISKNKKQK